MSERLETVMVKRDGPKGYRIINRTDFDPAVHVLHDPEQPADDGDGLTKAEIHADLEALGVEFDPRARKADLLALRNEARAKRDAG